MGGSPSMTNDDRLILTVLGRLNEAQARLYVAKEAICRGRAGVQRMHQLTGLSRPTIARGISELRQLAPADSAEDAQLPSDGFEDSEESNLAIAPRIARRPNGTQRYRIRRPGGGRKLIEEIDPAIIPALEKLLADEIAGDPMTEQKWIRSSLHVLSKKLAGEGHRASPRTVARLLRDMDFSLMKSILSAVPAPKENPQSGRDLERALPIEFVELSRTESYGY